ncbi:protein SIX6OS1 [Coturnix japonica]|uniref:protein SIX6OS1 n=1 Tax=Coturnix japonica TaxID=93934 RepID=UPI00077750B7|nr:protein SIX6OS1 [Coturnix japonica]XP_015721291.1 protein SIX6OS1 [Coturnix japonica]XP_015721292.1 protein SIX6OS1 [Coturnix japonica]XP_015721293.1 protein SIX6OS1 [Coturnix japonica]XP_032300977.1 protein SIX6OS1 [Coturnix japonica]
MMSDRLLSNLDKLLLEFVFQLKQTSYAKEHVNQQINLYSSKITEKRNEIARLQENINNCNDAIADLRKQNENSKDSCNVWKPTYAILSKHEEYLKNELEVLQEATENERKMYQDYIIQYKETLKQHREKYAETALAQEYYKKKKELEEIQNRIQKRSEQYKLKEDANLDILEPAPFKSINDWAIYIASLRQKTQEMLKLAETATRESAELEKEADELEMKINYLKKTFEETAEKQNNSGMIEGKNLKSLEKPKEFKERVFEESEHPSLLHEKHQLCKPLQLPCIPRKSVQSLQTTRFSMQRTETGREEKEDPMEQSISTSSSSSHAENPSQMVSGSAVTANLQVAQVPSIASFQSQTQFRLLRPPKQVTTNQQFESEKSGVEDQEAKCDDKEAGDEPKDSSYIPQDIHTYFKPNENNPDTAAEGSEHFLQAPKTPDSKGKKTQFSKTPPFDFIHNVGCEEATSKSPAFFSFLGISQKSPGFNLFDSSVFGAENSSDEIDESYSVGNLNPISPHKDFGSLFGKSESEDTFAFPFPLESTSHAFGDGKDDFSFPFAFGQDQRSSQSPSVKGFHSSLQNAKPSTFF